MANKSLVTQLAVDRAGRAHNCQANYRHRLASGAIRLKVKNGTGRDHYCQSCAEAIITRDIAKLTALLPLTPTEKVEEA